MNKYCAAAIASLVSLPVIAEETKPLTAEIEVGVITTSGNTETQSYKGSIDVTHDLENWKNHYLLKGLFKSEEVEIIEGGDTTSEDRTSAEKYFASAKADYKLDKKHAAIFGYAEYERDRFSGFDYQYTLAVGYSDRFFTKDNSYFAFDIGPGYTVNQPESFIPEGSTELFEPEEEDAFVVRVALEYLYEFSENAKFTQNISSNVNPDSDENTKTKSISAVSAKINGSLTLRASFTVDYNSEVSPGRKHADTETSLSVVYSI